jgi:hypothetical protein
MERRKPPNPVFHGNSVHETKERALQRAVEEEFWILDQFFLRHVDESASGALLRTIAARQPVEAIGQWPAKALR